jgi:predicted TIM-barrel fold metal-dependent hydrolase
MYNFHTHTATSNFYPRDFLPCGLVGAAENPISWGIVSTLMHLVVPFSNNDFADNYRRFAKIARNKSQEETLKELISYYDDYFKFIILALDLRYMGAGNVPDLYVKQLDELLALKEKYPQIRLFYMADPRNPIVVSQGIEYLKKGFSGIKIYPPTGYYPNDERLYPLYDYAEKNGIPVLAHCTRLGPVYYKGDKIELLKLLQSKPNQIKYSGKIKELCSNITNPDNYEYVLKDFSELKIILGHFGGSDDWEDYIKNKNIEDNWVIKCIVLMNKYNNVFCDISYTAYNKDNWYDINWMLNNARYKNQILYGDDWYMIECEGDIKRYTNEFRKYIGENNMRLIAHDNIVNNFVNL